MEHDPARIEDTREWLRRAQADLNAADLLIGGDLLEAAVFHCQQAVEKALKSVLAWHDEPVRKTHDLGAIGKKASELNVGLTEAVRDVGELTDFAWVYRYPGDPPALDLTEAAKALTTAHTLYDAILNLLPSEVHPG